MRFELFTLSALMVVLLALAGCQAAEGLEATEPTLEAAVASGKPAVLHVAVDAAANTQPPGYDLYVQSHSAR